MIEDSLGKRKHVVHYNDKIIPTKSEVEEILKIGYSLSTSKQKAFAYKFWVLGPNAKRSEQLWNIAEGRKIDVDYEAYGTTTKSPEYNANPGLFHIKSAPWTFIITPRQSCREDLSSCHLEASCSLGQLED